MQVRDTKAFSTVKPSTRESIPLREARLLSKQLFICADQLQSEEKLEESNKAQRVAEQIDKSLVLQQPFVEIEETKFFIDRGGLIGGGVGKYEREKIRGNISDQETILAYAVAVKNKESNQGASYIILRNQTEFLVEYVTQRNVSGTSVIDVNHMFDAELFLRPQEMGVSVMRAYASGFWKGLGMGASFGIALIANNHLTCETFSVKVYANGRFYTVCMGHLSSFNKVNSVGLEIRPENALAIDEHGNCEGKHGVSATGVIEEPENFCESRPHPGGKDVSREIADTRSFRAQVQFWNEANCYYFDILPPVNPEKELKKNG
jgi:hypothetical protein